MTQSFADVLKIHTDKKVDTRLAANMLGVSLKPAACAACTPEQAGKTCPGNGGDPVGTHA